jgi:hypothetical protein
VGISAWQSNRLIFVNTPVPLIRFRDIYNYYLTAIRLSSLVVYAANSPKKTSGGVKTELDLKMTRILMEIDDQEI